MRTRSNGTLDSDRRGVQSWSVRLNLAAANGPRQAAVGIGAGRDGRRVWWYVCRAAWSVWRREHRRRRSSGRRGGMGRTVRWARAVGEERDWMRRAGLRQCMDHDAVGGCGLSDEHEGWSRVLRRRRAGGGERREGCAPLSQSAGSGRQAGRQARGGVDYHHQLAGRSGGSGDGLQSVRPRALFVITYLACCTRRCCQVRQDGGLCGLLCLDGRARGRK